jgi:hypothetical protein
MIPKIKITIKIKCFRPHERFKLFSSKHQFLTPERHTQKKGKFDLRSQQNKTPYSSV